VPRAFKLVIQPLNIVSTLLLSISAIVTLMNVLSAISTGFWSRLGDAYGRRPIMALFLLGAIVM
jgi:MFS family permease